MKRLILMVGLCTCIMAFNSCNSVSEETSDETSLKTGRDTDFTGELPELSVYNLPSEWTNQNGEDIKLEDLRGNIIVAVMIYTKCKAACPRLIADVRRFALVLGVGYKRISPIDFSHSNIISVFNQNGELTFQKKGLGVDDEAIVEAIEKLAI